MRRTQAVLGSIAVHAVIAVALLSVDRTGWSREPLAPSTIEMIDAQQVELVDLAPPLTTAGGAPAGRRVQVATKERRSKPRRTQVDPRGTLSFEHSGSTRDADADGDGQAHGDGTGEGHGHGGGRGIGFGDGGGISPPAPVPAPPPAPRGDPPSKARPATLIFPTRQRDVEDAELFIARVTIDDEGFVVGAKLVRGFGGPRDEMASDLIWRFRYAPALDDAGRAIASTIEQRFLVGP